MAQQRINAKNEEEQRMQTWDEGMDEWEKKKIHQNLWLWQDIE